ncbi:MAG: mechanosensitive ion channel [Sphingomonadales bacterium]
MRYEGVIELVKTSMKDVAANGGWVLKRFWRGLIKPRSWIAALLLITLVVVFFALGYLDYLQEAKDILDSERLSFYVGDLRLSAYVLIKATITIIALFWLAGLLSDFGESRIKRLRHIRAANRALMIKALQIVAYFLAFIIGLDVLGIDLTTLTIFSGAVGIGVGFGLQKIASNFISGLILLFEKSIEADDLIELSDGTFGFIRYTRARYILVETFDGKEIMIPNEDFITSRVTNWTFTNSKGRVEILIGVSYESDIEKARELILEAANEHPRCINEPAPVCYLRNFSDSSVDFLLFFWVGDVTAGRYEPQSDVMRSIWKKFKENNITIPYPQRDIHLKSGGKAIGHDQG